MGMSLLSQWTFEAMCTQRWQRRCAATPPATSPILEGKAYTVGRAGSRAAPCHRFNFDRREVDGRHFAYC